MTKKKAKKQSKPAGKKLLIKYKKGGRKLLIKHKKVGRKLSKHSWGSVFNVRRVETTAGAVHPDAPPPPPRRGKGPK